MVRQGRGIGISHRRGRSDRKEAVFEQGVRRAALSALGRSLLRQKTICGSDDNELMGGVDVVGREKREREEEG